MRTKRTENRNTEKNLCKLKLPIAVLDCETTGLDTLRAHIVEISVLMVSGLFPLNYKATTFRFRPPIRMPKQALRVHGLSDNDLLAEPSFSERANTVHSLLAESQVWCGYRVGFDLSVLESEFRRTHRQLPPRYGRIIIDVFDLWMSEGPRNLKEVYREVIGEEMKGAHSSFGDALATLHLLQAKIARMKENYP